MSQFASARRLREDRSGQIGAALVALGELLEEPGLVLAALAQPRIDLLRAHELQLASRLLEQARALGVRHRANGDARRLGAIARTRARPRRSRLRKSTDHAGGRALGGDLQVRGHAFCKIAAPAMLRFAARAAAGAPTRAPLYGTTVAPLGTVEPQSEITVLSPAAGGLEPQVLGPLLRIHIACGRARARCERFIPIFALSSLVVWASDVWPRLVSGALHGAVLGIWLLAFGGLGISGLWEWLLDRRLKRLLSERPRGILMP